MNDLYIRPRTRLSGAAALIPTTAAVLLATTLAVGTFDRVGPTTSPAPSVTQPAADSSGGTQVVLRLSDGTATATLNDTAAAHASAALLPVQLTLRDPMGQAVWPPTKPPARCRRGPGHRPRGGRGLRPAAERRHRHRLRRLGRPAPAGHGPARHRDQRPAHHRFGRNRFAAPSNGAGVLESTSSDDGPSGPTRCGAESALTRPMDDDEHPRTLLAASSPLQRSASAALYGPRPPTDEKVGVRNSLVCELSGPVHKKVEDVAHRIDHHPHALLRLPLRLSGAE